MKVRLIIDYFDPKVYGVPKKVRLNIGTSKIIFVGKKRTNYKNLRMRSRCKRKINDLTKYMENYPLWRECV